MQTWCNIIPKLFHWISEARKSPWTGSTVLCTNPEVCLEILNKKFEGPRSLRVREIPSLMQLFDDVFWKGEKGTMLWRFPYLYQGLEWIPETSRSSRFKGKSPAAWVCIPSLSRSEDGASGPAGLARCSPGENIAKKGS